MKKNLLLATLFVTVLFYSTVSLASNFYPKFDPKRSFKPNGYINLYVKNSKTQWEFKKKIGFDKFFREQFVSLKDLMGDEKNIEIRITTDTKNATQIDSVLLNGKSPVKVYQNQSEIKIKKFAKKDFDVLNANEQTFDVVFEPKSIISDDKIGITARVEPDILSPHPFKYPVSNILKKVTPNSEFVTYKLNSNLKKGSKPLVKSYVQPISGHPNGYFYSWVWNDDKYLYSFIDFTGDNTFDGPLDYTKIYVKNNDSVKEFKVSLDETTWGHQNFTYTDKVDYEHKTYNFKIPLKDLPVEKDKPLELAFAGYGTVAVGAYISYEALLNVDDNTGVGVDVSQSTGTATISNVDYRIIANVIYDYDSNVFVNSIVCHLDEYSQWSCTPTADMSYEINLNSGRDGTTPIEFSVALSNIPNYKGSLKGYFHASAPMHPLSDYTSKFNYPLTVNAVPFIGQNGLIFFSIIIAGIAFWFLRKSNYRYVSVILIAISVYVTTSWAVTILVDGSINDWSSVKPIVTDNDNDSSYTGMYEDFIKVFEDIRYGYITSDDNNMYFRIDVTGGESLGD